MDPEPLGRYNDPTGRTGICYAADNTAAAIAESLGRVYQRDPDNFPQNWQEKDIDGFEIVVETLQFDVSADDS